MSKHLSHHALEQSWHTEFHNKEKLYHEQQNQYNRLRGGVDFFRWQVNNIKPMNRIVALKPTDEPMQRGKLATLATQKMWEDKFAPTVEAPLGHSTTPHSQHVDNLNILSETRLNHLLRNPSLRLNNSIEHWEIKKAVTQMKPFKKGGQMRKRGNNVQDDLPSLAKNRSLQISSKRTGLSESKNPSNLRYAWFN